MHIKGEKRSRQCGRVAPSTVSDFVPMQVLTDGGETLWVLTQIRVRTGRVRGNQIQSSNEETLGIPKIPTKLLRPNFSTKSAGFLGCHGVNLGRNNFGIKVTFFEFLGYRLCLGIRAMDNSSNLLIVQNLDSTERIGISHS